MYFTPKISLALKQSYLIFLREDTSFKSSINSVYEKHEYEEQYFLRILKQTPEKLIIIELLMIKNI